MKWIGIGIYSASGRTATILCVGGKPLKFGTQQKAEEYIAANRLGVHASPVEVHED
jgi:hypothetical protein